LTLIDINEKILSRHQLFNDLRMAMFFNSSLVAIDIGSSAIKMLELTGNAKRRRLKNFAVEPLPKGAIEHGLFVDPIAITDVLKKMVKQMGVKGRRTAVSISGAGAMIKKVVINAGKDATVMEQVDFHASQAFQIDPAEMYYDHAEMGLAPNGSDGVEVLLVGARREIVEQYVTVIKEAGMQLGIVEAGALSLVNMFEVNYGVIDGLIAVISIGASSTSVIFIDRGRVLYNHELSMGGDAFTAAIAQTMNMAWEAAESLKISAAASQADLPAEFQRIMAETNNTMSNEMRQVFSFFASSSDAEGSGPVKHAFLIGGGSRTLGIDAALATAVGVPIHLANPFQNIEIDERKFKLDRVMGLGPMFGVSIGLGTRSKGDKVAA
jgi:type IV pilus assembly protein PilM